MESFSLNKFSISIVIPAYNAQATISKTIEACLKQKCSCDYEVIVVDDGSTDETASIIKSYPVKYIYQENGGPAKARNTGWKVSKGDIICFTDSDCVPEIHWVAKIIKYYNRHDIAGVGGSYDIANPTSILARCIHQEIMQRHLKMQGAVDFLGSFNLSYKKKVLEEVGGFNEEFKHASGEDNDLSYRIRKKKYKLIFDKDIKVAHYHQTNFFKYLKEQFRHGYWRVKLYNLHPDMTKGDRYAGLADLIQPPLSILILISIFSSLISSKIFLPVFGMTTLMLIMLEFFLVGSVIKREKDISYLILLPVLFFRSFSRGLGMLKGVWDFYIKRK
jgi:glycosyltransferase involved in cell wall biosynthesis